MKTPLRPTPLELPRQALYQKHYSSVLCGDGRLLPIEERLGKRLLRTIDPESSEGRDLLQRGWVTLRTLEGTALEETSLARVYARLKTNIEALLDDRPNDESLRGHYSSLLEKIQGWEETLLSRSQQDQ